MEKIVGQTAITEVLKLVKQKDSELQNNIDINSTAIGTISELDTTDKSSLVNAINEINTEVDTNTANIATNTDNILANTNNIAANTTSISNINNQITTINNTLSRKADSSSLSPVATSGDYNDLINTPTIPTVNDGVLTIQRNSTTIDTFSANSSTDKTINISVPTAVTDLTDGANYSLITETGNKITLSIDSTTYELTAKLYDKNNTLINTSNAIDLPLESSIVNASYDNTTKDLTFTLQNGTTLTVPLDDMISGLASQSDLDALELRVQTNENNISTNTSDISNLTSDVRTNTSNINTLQTNQGALNNLNTTDKSSLVNAINEVNTQVGVNTSAISTNTSDISNLDGRLTTAEGNISTNATNITNLGTSKQDKLVAGTGISIDPVTNVIDGTVYTLPAATSSILGGIKVGANLNITGDGTLSAVAQPITIDNVLSTTSENPVQNKIIKNKIDSIDADISSLNTDISSLNTAIASKQDTLIAGTNIKNINNQSLLGSGNINISGSDSQIEVIVYILTALPSDSTDYEEGQKICVIDSSSSTDVYKVYTATNGSWDLGVYLDRAKLYMLLYGNQILGLESGIYGVGYTVGVEHSEFLYYYSPTSTGITQSTTNTFKDLESGTYLINASTFIYPTKIRTTTGAINQSNTLNIGSNYYYLSIYRADTFAKIPSNGDTFMIVSPTCSVTGSVTGTSASGLYTTVTWDVTTNFVDLTSNQTIGGVKTFSSVPVCATQPTSNNELANKAYVDTQISDASEITLITEDTNAYTLDSGLYKVQSTTGTGATGRLFVPLSNNFSLTGTNYRASDNEDNKYIRVTGEALVSVYAQSANNRSITVLPLKNRVITYTYIADLDPETDEPTGTGTQTSVTTHMAFTARNTSSSYSCYSEIETYASISDINDNTVHHITANGSNAGIFTNAINVNDIAITKEIYDGSTITNVTFPAGTLFFFKYAATLSAPGLIITPTGDMYSVTDTATIVITATKIGTVGGGGGDAMPVGTIVDYDGDTVPSGFEEVADDTQPKLEVKTYTKTVGVISGGQDNVFTMSLDSGYTHLGVVGQSFSGGMYTYVIPVAQYITNNTLTVVLHNTYGGNTASLTMNIYILRYKN